MSNASVISVFYSKATLYSEQGFYKLLSSSGINNCGFYLWLECPGFSGIIPVAKFLPLAPFSHILNMLHPRSPFGRQCRYRWSSPLLSPPGKRGGTLLLLSPAAEAARRAEQPALSVQHAPELARCQPGCPR